jgi:acyl-coenzyme A thioesterase PaaI-like protein
MRKKGEPDRMTDPRGFEPAVFVETLATRAHGGLIGLRYVNHGDDWAELAIDYADRLVGDEASGVLASGPILALMDMATSMSIWIRRKKFRPQATLDLRVDYIRQAHDGDPTDPVAHVAGTYMFTDL